MTSVIKSQVRSVAGMAGGGLTVGMVIFMYTTFVSRTELETSERLAREARNEMRQDQAETWRKLMDLQNAHEAQRATLDTMLRLARRSPTNAVATQ